MKHNYTFTTICSFVIPNPVNEFTIKIGGFPWTVQFVDGDDIGGLSGLRDINNFTIKIDKRLNYKAARLTFIHEVVHAILSCQGRHFQKKFDVEDVCEFIAFSHDAIESYLRDFDKAVIKFSKKKGDK